MSYNGLMNKIVFSFDDGATWVDVSDYIKWDTMRVSIRAMNEEFRMAQNEAEFEVIYEPTLYNTLISLTEDFLVQIYHFAEGTYTLGSFTLNGGKLQANSAYAIFTGHASYGITRTYNGIIDNTIIRISATDSGDLLDIPCGDIVYRSTATNQYKICDPGDQTYSIVHQLVNLCGFDANLKVNSNLQILDKFEENTAFAPTSEEDSVKELLDTLLHEYGYVLFFNEFDQVSAMPWIRSASYPIEHTFTDSDTMIITERKNEKQYEAIELTWYEMALGVTTNPINKTLVYRDSEMEYNQSEGGFIGYKVLAGFTYPPATNVIDDTITAPDPVTGYYQKVYQEYTTDGIAYFTNKAVVRGLDFNRNAFESDFSSIVATFDHEILSEQGPDIDIIVSEFGNKKARVVFENTGTTDQYIKYFNIFARMIYRTSKRKTKSAENILDRKMYKTEAKFIHTSDIADAYVKCRATQFKNALTMYNFDSLYQYAVGALVNISLNDGTNAVGIIMSRSLENATGKWGYVIKTYSTEDVPLTGRGVVTPSTLTQTQPVNASVNAQNMENLSGITEGSLRQVSTDGGITFYRYVSGSWVEVGGFSADNIRFDTDDASIGLGYNIMEYSSASKYTISIGNNAGKYKTTGDRCIYIGFAAGAGNLLNGANTGIDNVAIGNLALNQTTSSSYNVVIGSYAGAAIRNGSYSVLIGKEAGTALTSGGNNVMIGQEAGKGVTTGSHNISIGSNTLFAAPLASQTIAIGSGALYNASISNSYNIALGNTSFSFLATGTGNIAIGGLAGTYRNGALNLTSATNSIFIGDFCMGSATDGQSNQTVIGASAIGFGSNTVTIGNTSVNQFRVAGGNVTIFSGPSDPRLKEDIIDANLDICYANIKNLPLKRFKFKDFVNRNPLDVHVTGFLSTDVAKIFPKAVTKHTTSFPVLDENGNEVVEIVQYTLPNGTTKEIEQPKMFTIEDVENITMSELTPQLVGAVQKIMQDVELAEDSIYDIQQSNSVQDSEITTLKDKVVELENIIKEMQIAIANLTNV